MAVDGIFDNLITFRLVRTAGIVKKSYKGEGRLVLGGRINFIYR